MDFTPKEMEQINQLKKCIKACDTDKPYIFISYSKNDSLRVYPLIIELQKRGYNIWIDTRELETSVGQNWQDPALNGLADSNCKAVFFMISSNSLKSAPVFAEIMWSQDGPPVIRDHEGKSLTLKIVVSDGEYDLADGNIKNTVNNIISKDKTPLADPTDYNTMKYVTVISEKLYRGITRLKTKGNLAYEFYDCLFEKRLGGGNVTLADYGDIDIIIKNIPPECKCIEASPAVIKMSDGSVYTGEVKDGLPNGQGKMEYDDERFYEGKRREGSVAVDAPGIVKDKPYASDMLAYEGEYLEITGTYTGEWYHNMPNGEGTLKFSNGNIYSGTWKDGKANGQGTIKFNNGNAYTGEFKDGLFNGQGKFTFVSGDVYEGEFKDDERNGQGTMKYANGAVYEGEWKDGMKNGKGTMKYTNDTIFEGEWKGGMRNGQGKYIFASGTVFENEWKDGKIVKIK